MYVSQTPTTVTQILARMEQLADTRWMATHVTVQQAMKETTVKLVGDCLYATHRHSIL